MKHFVYFFLFSKSGDHRPWRNWWVGLSFTSILMTTSVPSKLNQMIQSLKGLEDNSEHSWRATYLLMKPFEDSPYSTRAVKTISGVAAPWGMPRFDDHRPPGCWREGFRNINSQNSVYVYLKNDCTYQYQWLCKIRETKPNPLKNDRTEEEKRQLIKCFFITRQYYFL